MKESRLEQKMRLMKKSRGANSDSLVVDPEEANKACILNFHNFLLLSLTNSSLFMGRLTNGKKNANYMIIQMFTLLFS